MRKEGDQANDIKNQSILSKVGTSIGDINSHPWFLLNHQGAEIIKWMSFSKGEIEAWRTVHPLRKMAL